MTVNELIESLKELPGEMPVYITACHVDGDGGRFGEAGLDFPKPVRAQMDPVIERELPEDERIGEFILLEPSGDVK